MSEEPTISDRQAEYLEEKLGVNLGGTQAVANDTKQFFAERAGEEGLTPEEMLTAIRAVKDSIEDAVFEAMEGTEAEA